MKPLFETFAYSCPIKVNEAVRGCSGRRTIMWVSEVAPERLAELFHHYQQALRPELSGKGSERGGEWKEVPPQEKNRLVSAVRLALLELESMAREQTKPRQYFAQPGEAEWGC
jgi:hypothetical protein